MCRLKYWVRHRSALLTALMMVCLFGRLSANNVDMQIRRMEYLQRMIEQKRQKIEETQSLKEINLQKKDDYQDNLNECETRIQQLNHLEYELVEDLIHKQRTAETTTRELQQVHSLWNEQLSNFYINHCLQGGASEKAVNERFYPEILTQTKNKIMENKELLTLVQNDIQRGRRRREEIQSSRKSEEKVSYSIKGEIKQLSGEVSSLIAEETSYREEIATLERNREALESLITHLQSDEYKNSYRFTKEKLQLPLKGQIVNNFGEMIDDTYEFILLNNGIDIESDEYQEIRSVDFGVVVFAESFRSYGRMVIIDHRNGYFSLYSNNASLLVTKGDIVSLGEAIAIAGKKGGSDKYFLHFELRRDGKPVNPADYFE